MLNTISAILQAAAASPEKRTIAVAAAHDRDVLEAVAEARRAGIAQAVLTGHGEKIREILRHIKICTLLNLFTFHSCFVNFCLIFSIQHICIFCQNTNHITCNSFTFFIH